MKGEIIPFERLCIGMLVVDDEDDEGRIQNLDDIHNVEIKYNHNNLDTYGNGFFCLDKNCEDYSPVYWVVAEEYHSDIIDSLFTKQPNRDDFQGYGSTDDYIDALLIYIERIKNDHRIEMEMMSSALEEDDKKIRKNALIELLRMGQYDDAKEKDAKEIKFLKETLKKIEINVQLHKQDYIWRELVKEQEQQIKELKALLNEYLNPDGQGNTFDDRVEEALNKD